MQLTHDEKLSDNDKRRPLSEVGKEKYPGRPYFLKVDDVTGEAAPVEYRPLDYPKVVYLNKDRSEKRIVHSEAELQALMASPEPVVEPVAHRGPPLSEFRVDGRRALVACPHCGGEYKNLGPHIRIKHPNVA